MSFLDIVLEAFVSWLWLFGAPIRDMNVLWIIIPIWVSWFFTEFFQEKKGTGFGNAITNGGVSLWVAIDWGRHLTRGLSEGTVATDYTIYVKFALVAFILLYGGIIIMKGLKRQRFASVGGRIRVITYILVMFTPIIYETADISAMNIISIFVFFPLFYFFLEIVDRIVPDSKALEEDHEETDKGNDPMPGLSSNNAPDKDPFGSPGNNQSVGDDLPSFGQSQNNDPFASGNAQTRSPQPPQGNPPGRNPFPNPGAQGPSPNPNMAQQNMRRRPTNNNPQMNPQQRQRMPQNNPQNQSQQMSPSQFKEPDFSRLPERKKQPWP